MYIGGEGSFVTFCADNFFARGTDGHDDAALGARNGRVATLASWGNNSTTASLSKFSVHPIHVVSCLFGVKRGATLFKREPRF